MSDQHKSTEYQLTWKREERDGRSYWHIYDRAGKRVRNIIGIEGQLIEEVESLRERNAWLENYVKACDNEIRRARGVLPASDVPTEPVQVGICNLGCTSCAVVRSFQCDRGSADIRDLKGWEFTTDTGWRCPTCAGSASTRG